MNAILTPVVKAMVLCDDIRPSVSQRGKVDLIGVGFHVIRSSSEPPFPYRHRQLCVFLQLTDAQGQGLARIVVRKADSDRMVCYSDEHALSLRNRLQVTVIMFRLRDCLFPEPGLYLIEFQLDGNKVAFQPVHLIR